MSLGTNWKFSEGRTWLAQLESHVGDNSISGDLLHWSLPSKKEVWAGSQQSGNMEGTIKRGNNWISGIAWNTAKPMSTVSENWRAQKPERTKKSVPICTAADNAMTMERNYLDHDCFNRVMFLASLTLWFHLFLSKLNPLNNNKILKTIQISISLEMVDQILEHSFYKHYASIKRNELDQYALN